MDIIIGIDPSINNTGVCMYDGEKHIYYIITSKLTRKMQNFSNKFVNILCYNKKDCKGLDYSEKEYNKFDNIYNICFILEDIIRKYKPSLVVMEGVSYGSIGSAALVDLSFLNSAIRMILKKNNIAFKIVSPTSLKKFACANGQAEKDIIIDAWKRLDKNINNISDIKIDDLADSYFLTHYNDG